MSQSHKTVNAKPLLGALLKGLVVGFGWLPLSANQALGAFIGRMLWWLPNSNRRITQQNIAHVYPHKTPQQQRALVKASLIELGKTITELGPVWRWSQPKLLASVTAVKGQNFIDEALAAQKGILFLGPHMGCWELTGAYISMHYPATTLYQPPNVPSVEAFMVQARSRFGAQLVPTDMRGVRNLIQALKAGRVSAILPDQDPGESGGVYAPFFGRPARTMTLVSKLIQKSDCAVLFAFTERLPNAQGYVLHFLPADARIASGDELEAATALNLGVEAVISHAPEQYLWSYKRFRKPPAGVVDIYKR